MKFFQTIVIFFFAVTLYSQNEISLFESFNGRYDFTMFGASNNLTGNSKDPNFDCAGDNISLSSTNFVLPPTATGVVKAYLYWAGTGQGDFNVKFSGPGGLNNMSITAQRTFVEHLTQISGLEGYYFSAAYDITSVLQTYGQGTYTLSELDVDKSQNYCPQTLFSGWAVVVVYEDPNLPLNSVKLYEGFKGEASTTEDFSLTGLKILVPVAAKLGILAWEGDDLPSLGFEGITVNGNQLTNTYNPYGELFNGSNSFDNSSTNYNMDLDYFDIEPYIMSGDVSIQIQATLGNDLVFLNVFMVSFNNELPDATVRITDHRIDCNDPDLDLDFTVYNINSNAVLNAGIDISFYANAPGGILLGTKKLPSDIAIGDSLSLSINVPLPATVGPDVKIFAVVEDGNTVLELEEDNNTFEYDFVRPLSYDIQEDYAICDGDSLVWNGVVYKQSHSEDFTYSTALGCDSVIHFNLVVQEASQSVIDTLICKGDSIFIGDTVITEPVNDMTFTLQSSIGCDSTVTLTVGYKNPNSSLQVTGDTLVNLGYPADLHITTGFTPVEVQWEPVQGVDCDTCPSVHVVPLETTEYVVEVMDPIGCTLRDSIRLQVIKLDKIFVPNAFSPNGDGYNERVPVFTDKDVKEIRSFVIYDRWGGLVYESSGLSVLENSGWDGMFRGKPMPIGVYAWQAIVEFIDGRTRVYSGDITLVR